MVHEMPIVAAASASGILNVIALLALVLATGYLIFANEGWGVFLPLTILATGVFFVLALVLHIFGGDLWDHEWLMYSIAAIPWVGMVLFQGLMIWPKLTGRKRRAEQPLGGDAESRAGGASPGAPQK